MSGQKDIAVITVKYFSLHSGTIQIAKELVNHMDPGVLGAIEGIQVRLRGIRMRNELAIRSCDYMGACEAAIMPASNMHVPPNTHTYYADEVLQILEQPAAKSLREALAAQKRPQVVVFDFRKHPGFDRSEVNEELFLALMKLCSPREGVVSSDMFSMA